MAEEKRDSFEILNDINLGNKVKEKIGFKYLSWADAWTILKKNYPNAKSTIYSRTVTTTETTTQDEGGYKKTITTTYENEIPYFTDGRTCFVKVGVTIDDREYIEQYPIMDRKNNALPLASVTMTAVNTALQRAFVKACARHGLGLYIYAGEDLPEVDRQTIDYDGILNQVLNMSCVQMTANDFEDLRANVISRIQSGNYSGDDEIMSAIAKLLRNKRISQLTYEEDCGVIQQIAQYLNLIDATINTNGR